MFPEAFFCLRSAIVTALLANWWLLSRPESDLGGADGGLHQEPDLMNG
jgi:hypothetical protein